MSGNDDSPGFALDLRLTDEGVTCEEYSTIMAVGVGFKNMSQVMVDRMNQHTEACAYHRSSTFTQSMLGVFITPELEEAAEEIIEKYDSMEDDDEHGTA